MQNKNKNNTMPTTTPAPAPAAAKPMTTPAPAPAAAKPAKPEPKPLPAGMPHDKGLLLEVFAIQNPSRNRACNDHAMATISRLAPAGCTIIRNKGNMLVRKGPAKGPHPYFLAHMDQVHDYVPFMKVRISGTLLHATDGNDERCGVGGDDKCGIYLALMMLHTLDHCTAVFVRDEEVGCLGSGDVPLGWFKHAAFVIQADRNNRTMDVIRETNGMNCASDEFLEAILGLPVCMAAGHRENTGSVTDIGELAERELCTSMVNISSGYHNPHSRTEIVMLDELSVALQLAFEASSLLGGKHWEHTPTSTWGGYRGTGTATTGSTSVSYYPRPSGHTVSERDPWGDDWSDDLRGNAKKNDFLTANEVEQMQLQEDENHSRLELMDELTSLYGYDREFDCLDNWGTETLEDVLEDHEVKAQRRSSKK